MEATFTFFENKEFSQNTVGKSPLHYSQKTGYQCIEKTGKNGFFLFLRQKKKIVALFFLSRTWL
jgi:hypothetical protein